MKLLLALACTFSLSVNAQLETVSISPYWMVSTEFLGPNYDVSNVQYTGSPLSFGQFDGTGTNLGLSTGIILTTGTVLDSGDGPHGPNNNGGAGLDNGFEGYDLLSTLVNYSTYNASVLEFDFIPNVDSISMKFVFGSEEYPEYVGIGFNDAFGIFISGPGILGLQNIATLSNGTAVSIDNVNNGTSVANYVHNGDGATSPYNSSDYYIQYDGFTQDTRASMTGLQVGVAYHLIIAIADGGDGIIDSGVFIESCETCNYAVGIDEKVSEIKLYPNPAKNVLFIEKMTDQKETILIQDAQGKTVLEQQITDLKSEISISELNSGVYLVTLQSGTEVTRTKLVVQD